MTAFPIIVLEAFGIEPDCARSRGEVLQFATVKDRWRAVSSFRLEMG